MGLVYRGDEVGGKEKPLQMSKEGDRMQNHVKWIIICLEERHTPTHPYIPHHTCMHTHTHKRTHTHTHTETHSQVCACRGRNSSHNQATYHNSYAILSRQVWMTFQRVLRTAGQCHSYVILSPNMGTLVLGGVCFHGGWCHSRKIGSI